MPASKSKSKKKNPPETKRKKSTLMNKPVSLVLLVVGIILIIYGVSASESIGSDFSRFFTGSPTDRTIWFLIGGAVATAIGLAGVMRGSKS